MNWVAGRSGYTVTQSMQLKRNEQIKSMRIAYTVVSKDSTGNNTSYILISRNNALTDTEPCACSEGAPCLLRRS